MQARFFYATNMGKKCALSKLQISEYGYPKHCKHSAKENNRLSLPIRYMCLENPEKGFQVIDHKK
jgi:hypothetical protein